MKEKTLKELFISSLRSGHIDYINSDIPRVNTNYEVTIKEEGIFGILTL